MTEEIFKYFAFISYNSKDTEWGKRVQKKLENYRMPATLCSEHGWKRKPIKPVFFAPTDIQPGGLTEELQERLRASRNLIVICSPNSAKSEWVGREIAFFHELGRTKQIHFFIVDGTPHSGNEDTECFNPVVDTLGLPEILGANIHEQIYRWPWMNKERAYVQLVSKLLGVEFDAIWQRHKRQLVKKAVLWFVAAAVVLTALISVWAANQPIDVEVRLTETSVRNDRLPALSEAVVVMTLDNETKTDTIHSLDGSVLFTNVPHRFLDQPVRMMITAPNFLSVDTLVTLSPDIVLSVQRDPKVFGHVRFRLWDSTAERGVAGVKVSLAGQETTSDANGAVELTVPLSEQRAIYQVNSSIPLVSDSIYMPSGKDDVVLVK